MVDLIVSVEVVVEEQVTGLECVERDMGESGPLRLGRPRYGDARLGPGPLHQSRAVESNPRFLAPETYGTPSCETAAWTAAMPALEPVADPPTGPVVPPAWSAAVVAAAPLDDRRPLRPPSPPSPPQRLPVASLPCSARAAAAAASCWASWMAAVATSCAELSLHLIQGCLRRGGLLLVGLRERLCLRSLRLGLWRLPVA